GAGVSVMLLAALAIVVADTLVRINALKQACALVVNVAAAAFFVTSDRIDWPFVAAMAAGSLLGGALGGKLASRIPAATLRWVIVVLGVALAIAYFVRAY